MDSPKIETEIITMRVWRTKGSWAEAGILTGESLVPARFLALKCIEVRKEAFSKSILTFCRKL